MLTFFFHLYALQSLSTTRLNSAARAGACTAGCGKTKFCTARIFIITSSSASITITTVSFRTLIPASGTTFCYASCYRQYNKNLNNIDKNFAFVAVSLTEWNLKIQTVLRLIPPLARRRIENTIC